MSDTVLVSLSSFDPNLADLSIILGYAVKSVDCTSLEAAAKRLVEKWRLLAGSVEWSGETSLWSIRVPLKGDVSDRLNFTTSKQTGTLGTLPILKDNSVEFVKRPPREVFCYPSTHHSLQSISSTNAPILSIHVTEFTNCTCVGISLPHGIFDAFGIGQVVRGLDAEMQGKPWDVPVLRETNILEETMHELEISTPLPSEEPHILTRIRRVYVAPTIKNLLAFGVRTLYEFFWHKVEMKSIYFGEAVVRDMVQKVKREVKNQGSGWVSTGDVLVAWFLKALFATETDGKFPCSFSLVSMRSTLSHKEPAFNAYSHNCIIPSAIQAMTKDELRTMSMPELALLHRQSIDAVRNIPFINTYNHWMRRTTSSGKLFVSLRPRDDTVFFTNQTIGKWDQVDFGSEIFYFWLYVAPFAPDHLITLKQFKEGYIIEANVRRARWKAVAELVERINGGVTVK
ncbi:hypothetical protein H0H87_004886 [Tephrocybe sp. NHM501043]|nr:hypothetical protein H0H87_004886 [Tephrocybe sp. NHM501043]